MFHSAFIKMIFASGSRLLRRSFFFSGGVGICVYFMYSLGSKRNGRKERKRLSLSFILTSSGNGVRVRHDGWFCNSGKYRFHSPTILPFSPFRIGNVPTVRTFDKKSSRPSCYALCRKRIYNMDSIDSYDISIRKRCTKERIDSGHPNASPFAIGESPRFHNFRKCFSSERSSKRPFQCRLCFGRLSVVVERNELENESFCVFEIFSCFLF